MATIKLEGLKGRTDMFKVDPFAIKIEENVRLPKNVMENVATLKESIRELGQLQPIRVRKDETNSPVVIDGECRLRAIRELIEEGATIDYVLCVFESSRPDEAKQIILQLASNEGKRLEPVEEAAAYAKLINHGMSAQDVAKAIGKTKVHVYERLKLNEASDAVKEAVNNGEIGLKAAVKLVKETKGSTEEMDAQLPEVKQEVAAKEAAKHEKRKATMAQKQEPTQDGGEDNEGTKEEPQEEPQEDPKEKPKKATPKEPTDAELNAVDRDELEDLLAESILIFQNCTEEDEKCKYFHAGMIRALNMVLNGRHADDPVELPL